MQLMFTIHVIITLMMLKPASSKTCDNANWKQFKRRSHCPQTNMYFKEIPTEDLEKAGKCCETVDPSYANQPTTCLPLQTQNLRKEG